jgi:gliding motility-associated-like protein
MLNRNEMGLLSKLQRLSCALFPALLIGIAWMTSASSLRAQVDTEFWFVAPEVWANHGDSPTLLRFATFDEPTVITVEQPANSSFPTQTLTVAANAVASLNLAPWLSQVENKPANSILNFGLHITSTSLVEAYYEVNPSNNLNPDIFALKGANALGVDFVVPFQMYLNNAYSQSTSSFDIVATEDSTTVTITPRKAIIGHPANVAFTILLHEGQTWSGRASSTLAAQHPSGTTVTSDKPIAITMSDDSVQGTPYGGCADIMGDQIVPVNIVGTEYIAIKGNLNGPDKVFIVPTVPGTVISLNGNVVSTLPSIYSMYTHTLTAAAAYYTTTEPVYVLHLTGFGCEVGGALLPPIVCTGSQEVAFVRSTNEFIGLKILVPSGGEDDFTFNGNANNVQASDFNNVPGTGGAWKYANITASSFVPTLQASRLSNSTSQFHLGIIHGGASSGTRYGYFSNYAAQAYVVQVEDNTLCEGESLDLEANELIGATYDWTGPNGFTGQGNPLDLGVLDASDNGEYVVSGFVGSCPIANDTLLLTVSPVPELPVIEGTTWLCEGASIALSTDSAGAVQYDWYGPTGALPDAPEITITDATPADSGTYSLVINDHGCFSPVATWDVSVQPQLSGMIDVDSTVVCSGSNILVNSLNTSASSWEWTAPSGGLISNGTGMQITNAQVDQTGWYILDGLANNCPLQTDSVWIEITPTPQVLSIDAPPVCLGADASLTAETTVAGCTWTWFDADGNLIGQDNPLIISNVDWENEQLYQVIAELNGCFSDPLAASFQVEIPGEMDIVDVLGNPLNDFSVCEGENLELFAEGPSNAAWQWSHPLGNVTGESIGITNAQNNNEGWYILSGEIGNCPMISDSVFLQVLNTPSPPILNGFEPICEGGSATLTAQVDNGVTVVWNHTFFGTYDELAWNLDSVPFEGNGTYTVYAIENGCVSASVSADLEVVPLPDNIAVDFPTISVTHCPGAEAICSLPNLDGAYQVEWNYIDDQGNVTFVSSEAGIQVATDGLYEVQLSTGPPCYLSASGAFIVETVVCEMVIPNVITPNSDGDNDRFHIPDLSFFPGSSCTIYNRWGQAVFASNDFGNTAGWRPTEDEASDGTYYYVIQILRDSGILSIEDQYGIHEITEVGPLTLTGSLTLLR